jgi:hypothetical protein
LDNVFSLVFQKRQGELLIAACFLRCAAILRKSSAVSNHDGKISGGSCGAIAQLGERIVRNDEVVGSIPTSSTNVYARSFDCAQDFGSGLLLVFFEDSLMPAKRLKFDPD